MNTTSRQTKLPLLVEIIAERLIGQHPIIVGTSACRPAMPIWTSGRARFCDDYVDRAPKATVLGSHAD
jgi:hypothetical protein